MPLDQQLDLLEKLDANGYEGVRRYARTYLKNPWVVLVDHKDGSGTEEYSIRDIGRCGMFIESDKSFSLGELITMRFKMPASEKTFNIIGKVVRYQPGGVGVKFVKQLT